MMDLWYNTFLEKSKHFTNALMSPWYRKTEDKENWRRCLEPVQDPGKEAAHPKSLYKYTLK